MVIDLAKFEGKNFINGSLVQSKSEDFFQLINPAKNEVIVKCPESCESDVSDAVLQSQKAYAKWQAFEGRDRGAILFKIAEKFEENAEKLAHIITLETGKAIRTESRVEAKVFADIFKFYAGLASELKGEELPFRNDIYAVTKLEPLGVVAAIIPWNVPLMMFALKVAPALLAGNAVVVKPSEEAPIAVLHASMILSETLKEMGAPKGLVNVVMGGGETGAFLSSNKLVKKISFTGSVATGIKVGIAAAEKVVPATLELGGKGSMIVTENANIDKAVSGFIEAMRFTRQGQSCSAASRLYLHEKIYSSFLTKLEKQLNLLKIGDPFDDETDVGSIISENQYNRICEFIEIGKKEGEILEFSNLNNVPQNGFYLRPIIFTNLPKNSRLIKEEIFGPVAICQKFKELDEAIKLANDSDFALSSSLWTDNLQEAMKVQEIESGLVQVNQCLVVQAGLPYGGHKNSGLGVEACLKTVKEHFMKSKTIMINCN